MGCLRLLVVFEYKVEFTEENDQLLDSIISNIGRIRGLFLYIRSDDVMMTHFRSSARLWLANTNQPITFLHENDEY